MYKLKYVLGGQNRQLSIHKLNCISLEEVIEWIKVHFLLCALLLFNNFPNLCELHFLSSTTTKPLLISLETGKHHIRKQEVRGNILKPSSHWRPTNRLQQQLEVTNVRIKGNRSYHLQTQVILGKLNVISRLFNSQNNWPHQTRSSKSKWIKLEVIQTI